MSNSTRYRWQRQLYTNPYKFNHSICQIQQDIHERHQLYTNPYKLNQSRCKTQHNTDERHELYTNPDRLNHSFFFVTQIDWIIQALKIQQDKRRKTQTHINWIIKALKFNKINWSNKSTSYLDDFGVTELVRNTKPTRDWIAMRSHEAKLHHFLLVEEKPKFNSFGRKLCSSLFLLR